MIKKLTRGLLATILAAALYPTNIMAQDQQSLTMPTLEDLIPGGETYRYTENLYGLQWWGDQCIKPEIDSLFAINPKNGRETLLTTRAKVNEVLRSLITPTAGEAQGKDEVMHFYNTEFPWPDKPHMLIKGAKRYIVYDFEKNEFVIAYPQAAKERGANIDFSPEGGHIAYTVKNNLYVDNKKVTNEPEGIVCGQSVHRNEFGITKGTFWSPKGNLLAFYRMNESMVTPYPLVDITQRIAVTDPIRYPMAGMLSHQVKVGIYNPATGETLYLDAGDPKDRYFTNISWAPDEKSLFLIEVNRDQNHAKLCQYDAQTGKLLGVLLEERHEKYVEPQQPIVFLPWDDNQFIYQSQRDGYNHLYLYDLAKLSAARQPQPLDAEAIEKMWSTVKKVGNGKNVKEAAGIQLTSGEWLVQSILGFNTKKKEVIIAATKESPLQSNIYKVRVKDGKLTPIDNGQGVHNAQLSASGTYVIDNWSSPQVPRSIGILSTANGKETAHLLTAEDPFKGLVMPTVETGTLKAADGKTAGKAEQTGALAPVTEDGLAPVAQDDPDEKVYDITEMMPEFPGGNEAMMDYLKKNIKYPESAKKSGKKGRVIVQFTIGSDGGVRDVKVRRGVDPDIDKEAVRVVSSMPKWTPGKQDGKPVAVKYTLPILFDNGNKAGGDAVTIVGSESRKGTKGNLIYVVGGKKVADISGINEQDIDHIVVLKGEQAVKKYGDDAKDGVMEITMKKK